MALKDIIASIHAKLTLEVQKIEEEETKELQRLKNLFERDEQEIKTDLKKQFDEKKNGMELKMETLKKMEERNMHLRAKFELIQTVFDRALAQLADLPDEQYGKWLENALGHTPKEKATIIPAKGRKMITKRTVEALKLPFTVTDEGSFRGGFTLQAPNIEINATFETLLLEQMKPELETQVSQTLFA